MTATAVNLAQKARQYAYSKSDMSVIEFVESPQGFNTRVFPAQRFFLKVFEKEPLDDTVSDIEVRDRFNKHVVATFTEAGFYEYLRRDGRISLSYEEYCATDIVQLHLCWGRRASKSTVIGLWVGYKLYQILNIYQPQLHFGIIPTDPMNITMTALGQENANKLFKRFTSFITKSQFFKRFLREPASVTQLKLWTQHDLDTGGSNSITVTASPNTPGVRGENNIFIVGDEFAHFNKSPNSTRDKPLDEMIYEALTPSVSGFKNPDGTPFGKALFLSSPNGQQGKFHADFKSAMEKGAETHTLAIQCPTWEVNPIVAPAFLQKAFNDSPASYDQEYGALFTVGGLNWLREMGSYYASFDTRLVAGTMAGSPAYRYFLGVDFALSKDGTAVCVCHWEPDYPEPPGSFVAQAKKHLPEIDTEAGIAALKRPAGKFVVDYVAAMRPTGGMPLDINAVLDWIGDVCWRYPIQAGVFDQWAGEVIAQLVEAHPRIRSLEKINFSEFTNDNLYKLFSQLLHSGQLKMPYEESLSTELLNLRVENRGRGLIKVEKPAGTHAGDDRFDAMIRSLFLAHAYHTKNYTLVGESLQNLFRVSDPVRRGGATALANVRTDKQLRRIQAAVHQTGLSIRNPSARVGNVMGRGHANARGGFRR